MSNSTQTPVADALDARVFALEDNAGATLGPVSYTDDASGRELREAVTLKVLVNVLTKGLALATERGKR